MELKNNYATFDLLVYIGKYAQQKIRVLLTGSPTNTNIDEFARFMNKNDVTDVFCFCEPEYDPTIFANYNLSYHKLSFMDGISPPIDIINIFDETVNKIIAEYIMYGGSEHDCIMFNMHCHSGLGRSPTVLAYMMISRCDTTRIGAVGYIRQFRRGALNKVQLTWILTSDIKKIRLKKTKNNCDIL
jgi:protein tyrosine phosphatase type 4A